MTRIFGRFASPVLSVQAALVVRRGTAPTFMKEFSSQLERFARHRVSLVGVMGSGDCQNGRRETSVPRLKT
jgi:hypothetical protein